MAKASEASTPSLRAVPSETSGASVPPQPVGPLKDRLEMYLQQHSDVSIAGIASRTGVSPSVLYNVKKGKDVSDKNTARIEDFLAGKSSGIFASKPIFDPTLESLIKIITELTTKESGHQDLIRLALMRWSQVEGGAQIQDFSEGILRHYLVAETPENRLQVLLEIRDFLKPKPPMR